MVFLFKIKTSSKFKQNQAKVIDNQPTHLYYGASLIAHVINSEKDVGTGV